MNTKSSASTTKRQGGCCCAGKSAPGIKIQQSSCSSDTDLPRQRFKVEGATCGGCVRSIEQTLRAVAGVSEVCMDLTTGVVSVRAMAPANDLIEALERVGFPATLIK